MFKKVLQQINGLRLTFYKASNACVFIKHHVACTLNTRPFFYVIYKWLWEENAFVVETNLSLKREREEEEE